MQYFLNHYPTAVQGEFTWTRARKDDAEVYAPPLMIRALTWMFLPPEESTTRNKITQGFTRAALRCLKVRKRKSRLSCERSGRLQLCTMLIQAPSGPR
jgi:hypothetical protein